MAHTPRIQVITPNDEDQNPWYPTTSVFLAGPTDTTPNWRTPFLATLRNLHSPPYPTAGGGGGGGGGTGGTTPHPNVTVYDPYQPRWDKTWKEDLGDDCFRAQVEWELERQDRASVVAVFFCGPSQAPISLLELGLCARSGKAVVGCEQGFCKRGNVQAVCQRYGVPMADSVDGLAGLVAEKLKGMRA